MGFQAHGTGIGIQAALAAGLFPVWQTPAVAPFQCPESKVCTRKTAVILSEVWPFTAKRSGRTCVCFRDEFGTHHTSMDT
jgi:hypothetical protein